MKFEIRYASSKFELSDTIADGGSRYHFLLYSKINCTRIALTYAFKEDFVKLEIALDNGTLLSTLV